jgi:hypothetical protein
MSIQATKGTGITAEKRSEVLSLLGLDPVASYAPARVVRGPRVRQGNIVRERVELQAEDGHVVPCLFLTPLEDIRAAGAVIAVHQHGGNYAVGKSEPAGLGGERQMAYAVELAESGVPTLVPDLMGFEDRQREGEDPHRAENLDAWHGGSIDALRITAVSRTLLVTSCHSPDGPPTRSARVIDHPGSCPSASSSTRPTALS